MHKILLKDVCYIRDKKPILNSINWEINEGENWIVLGPNGSGKTSILSLIAGYEWPSDGSITVLGNIYGNCNLKNIRSKIAVFNPGLADSFFLYHPLISAIEAICTGIDSSFGTYRTITSEERTLAAQLIQNNFHGTGDSKFPERRYSLLSAGEKRKILILRMLMQNPEILILDEPYESLDIPSRMDLESLLYKTVTEKNLSMIIILHRIEEIPVFATHVLLLKNGSILNKGLIEEVLTSRNISELFDTELTIEKRKNRYVCILPE